MQNNAPASFASRVFFWSGLDGLVTLLPLYFMEDPLGRVQPPAFNRPEQFYGLPGVAAGWQLAFLMMAKDVGRYRRLMLPAALDCFLGCLFCVAYFRSASPSPGGVAGMTKAPTAARAATHS